MPDFRRSRLPHDPPSWIDPTHEAFFITINTVPRHRNQLAHPAIWQAIVESIEHREQRTDWSWPLLLAMPDHLHGIVTFPERFFLRRQMAEWIRWLATRNGIVWQNGFFDHRLRSWESAAEKGNYIRLNPVRAELVARPEDWPYVMDRLNR